MAQWQNLPDQERQNAPVLPYPLASTLAMTSLSPEPAQVSALTPPLQRAHPTPSLNQDSTDIPMTRPCLPLTV